MDPRHVLDRLLDADVAACGAAEAASLLRAANELAGWVSVFEASVATRVTEIEAHEGGQPTADVIARATRSSGREASKRRDRAEALDQAPEFGRLRAKGRLSDEHTDRLANAAAKLQSDEQRDALFEMGDELAQHAAASTPAQFSRHLGRIVDAITGDDGLERSERQRQAARLTHGLDDRTGMGWIHAELHPDDYQRVARRLDAEVVVLRSQPEHEGARYDQLAAVGFVGLATSTRAIATPPADVMVLIDLASLTDGPHTDTVSEYSDGSPVPVETVRRHACTANIIPAVLDGAGQPLDVGRAKRQATPAQRRALRTMYRTCAVDRCERSFEQCDVHHLLEWERDHGRTDLSNLVPLCSHHHHRSHEGRWRLQLDPSTRQLTVTLPNGTVHSTALPDMIGTTIVAA